MGDSQAAGDFIRPAAIAEQRDRLAHTTSISDMPGLLDSAVFSPAPFPKKFKASPAGTDRPPSGTIALRLCKPSVRIAHLYVGTISLDVETIR